MSDQAAAPSKVAFEKVLAKNRIRPMTSNAGGEGNMFKASNSFGNS